MQLQADIAAAKRLIIETLNERQAANQKARENKDRLATIASTLLEQSIDMDHIENRMNQISDTIASWA